MAVARTAYSSVDRFFQFSMLGLLSSGYLAVAGSGVLDTPTLVLVACGLALRGLLLSGVLTFTVPDRYVRYAALAYIAFCPIDWLWISRGFVPATVHLVFFLTVAKLLTARTNRDYFYLKTLAFLEILAASILSSNLSFLVFLVMFLLFGVATFSSGEILRSMQSARGTVRSGVQGLGGRITAISVFASAGILILTAGLFFLLPRTARAAFRKLVPESYHLTGFSNSVTLGQIGELKKQNTSVMHVRFFGPERQYSLKWRGAALAEFDGRRWFSAVNRSGALPDQALQVTNGEVKLNRDGELPAVGPLVGYQVQLKPMGSDYLFIAGRPQFLRIGTPMVLRTAGDGLRISYPHPEGLRYVVYSYLGEPRPDRIRDGKMPFVQPLSAVAREIHLRLPQIDPRIRALAARVMPARLSDAEKAMALERYLRSNYGYTAELLSKPVEDPLAHFLFVRRKGHCEYFASSMAVMLRLQGIPSRVVTGFQSGIYNPISGWHLIRASDAHSWVEAWLDGLGWVTFDPTPPDPNSETATFWSRFSLYLDAAEVFWQDWVLNYDIDRQLRLAEQSRRRISGAWVETLQRGVATWLRAMWSWLLRYGVGLVSAAAFIVVLWIVTPGLLASWHARKRVQRVKEGRASAEDATALYQRMLNILRKRGFEKPAWVTPGEFAKLIPPSETASLVRDATLAYNELRFGGRAEAAPRLASILARLESET